MTPEETWLDALQDLHKRAGFPSTRAIAAKTPDGISHTTVYTVMSGHISPWSTTWQVIKALDGDPHELQELWLAAKPPKSPRPIEQRVTSLERITLRLVTAMARFNGVPQEYIDKIIRDETRDDL